MIDDRELLRRYAEEKSEGAFAELVRRRIDFVYACALRRVGGDAGLAQDVVQVVFAALAQQARVVARHASLAGWLFTTTRYASARVVRGERRRQAREQEAHTMMDDSSAGASAQADWERLRPVLDAALDQLGERDREAVLLRFFEQRSFAEVGERLSLTENAARMRVERALDKLHGLLAGRGVKSTSAALALALAGQAAVAAPAGLAATVAGTALAGGVAVGTGAGGVIAGLLSATKLQVGLAAAVLVAGAGVVLYERGGAGPRDELKMAAPGGERFGPGVEKPGAGRTVVQAPPLPKEKSEEAGNSANNEIAQRERRALAQEAAILAARLSAARDELARLRERYRDAHPTVVEQLRTIADLEARFADLNNRLRKSAGTSESL